MKLYYRSGGHGDPLIILHGLFGISDNWITIARQLEKQHHVILVDQRNHGRSPHHPDINYELMVEDLYELLTDLSLRKIHLIGHSMGGKVAMQFACEYPHRVQSLTVVDIAPKQYPMRHKVLIDAMLSLDLSQVDRREDADRLLEEKIQTPSIRQFLLKNLYRETDGRYHWRLNLPVLAENLPQLGAGLPEQMRYDGPTKFIAGGDSEYITPGDYPLILAHFPEARIDTIPGATHWVHAQKPDELLEILGRFVPH
jgi:esterase